MTPVADRMGLRYSGPGVKWKEREQPFGAGSDPSNIVDAGYAVGSIQIPGGTQPIILHRDAVSGGGYAMVGTVISADMDLVARAAPARPPGLSPSAWTRPLRRAGNSPSTRNGLGRPRPPASEPGLTDRNNHNAPDRSRGRSCCATTTQQAPFDSIPPRGIVVGMDQHSDHSSCSTTSLVKDPVCGMDVDPATSEHVLDRDGETRSFCSPGCRATFEADPDAYTGTGAGPDGAPHGLDHEHHSGHDHEGHAAARGGARRTRPRPPSGRARCTREIRATWARDVPDLRHGARAA